MVVQRRKFQRELTTEGVVTPLGKTTTVTTGPQYCVGTNDRTVLVDDDIAAAAVLVLLPAAIDNKNRELRVKKLGSTAAVTVDGNGSETIDDATTQIITGQYDAMHLVCDGSNWWIM